MYPKSVSEQRFFDDIAPAFYAVHMNTGSPGPCSIFMLRNPSIPLALKRPAKLN